MRLDLWCLPFRNLSVMQVKYFLLVLCTCIVSCIQGMPTSTTTEMTVYLYNETKTFAENTTWTEDTTPATESTRSSKLETKQDDETELETEENAAILYSGQFQTMQPKMQCGRRYARRGRIVGGKEAYEGEFPWAVSVRLLTTHYCGGVIINKYWVLTAAHCVKRYSARYFRIRTGDIDVNIDATIRGKDINVDEVSVHPDFGNPRRYSNDLALLKMRTPFTFDAYVQPICLPPPDRSLEGRNATVVGWGWLNEIDKVKAKRLQKVEVPILNNSICAKWYSDEYDGYVQIHDYQICAGYKEGGRDACQGDSGGPLIMKDGKTFSIIGIVSAGVGCARKQLPGIYSRVSVFVNWIQKVTGNSL